MPLYIGQNKIKDSEYSVFFCPGRTNCFTYTPKTINLSVNAEGVLTLHANSVFYRPNGANTFEKHQNTVDCTRAATNDAAGDYFVFYHPEEDRISTILIAETSSSTGSIAGIKGESQVHFNLTENKIMYSPASGTTWTRQYSFPLGIVEGNSEEKFSKVKQVFDWCGYLGGAVFLISGTKGLIPNGYDGTIYKNINWTANDIVIRDLSSYGNNNYILGFDGTKTSGIRVYSYDRATNFNFENSEYWPYTKIAEFTTASGNITKLTPQVAQTTNTLIAIPTICNGSSTLYQFK